MHNAEIDIRHPGRVRATLDCKSLGDRFPTEHEERSCARCANGTGWCSRRAKPTATTKEIR